MGINDLGPTLRDIEKDVKAALLTQNIQTNGIAYEYGVPLNFFKRKKIAFDASVTLHAKIMSSHQELLALGYSFLNPYDRSLLQNLTMKKIIGFFISIISEGITPVVGFDGKIHPYKLEEIKRRAAETKKKNNKVETLAEIYMNISPLDRTQEMEDEIKKASKYYVKITREDYILMEQVLTELGICCIKAQYEGEKLCASLSREGIVDAVYSSDTDCLPLGVTKQITKIEYNKSMGMLICDTVSLHGVFYLLQCQFGYQSSMDQFIDFCIMCGCDFNERMVVPKKKHDPINPYKSCGPKTSLELIKQYVRFENFPAYLYPLMYSLNIARCREMFAYEPSGYSDENTNLDWELFLKNKDRICSTYQLEYYNRLRLSHIDKNLLKLKKKDTMIPSLENLTLSEIEPIVKFPEETKVNNSIHEVKLNTNEERMGSSGYVF